jgi:putative tricarboxylic transport membrane protein
MRTAERTCAAVILALGLVAVLDARRYGIFGWGAAGPEPGLYLFLLGTGLIVGSLVVLGQTYLRARRADGDEPFIPPGALKPILSVAVPAALMLFLTEFIGLYLASGLYLAVYMRWIGKHRWGTVAACSILIPLSGYILFDKLFLIPVPEGSLTSRLGLGF